MQIIFVLSLFLVIHAGGTASLPKVTQLNEFLMHYAPEIEEIIKVRMELLTDFPQMQVNMTFPSYLRMSGDLVNLTFSGASNIRHKWVYSDIGMFQYVAALENSTLHGRHDFRGTITLKNGTIVAIGGGIRDFRITTKLTPAVFEFPYWIEDNGYVTVPEHPQRLFVDLNPSVYQFPDTDWVIDMDGLLDPIQGDAALVENAEAWIATEILENIKFPFDGLEKLIAGRIVVAYELVLARVFDKLLWNDVINHRFPTTTTPLPIR